MTTENNNNNNPKKGKKKWQPHQKKHVKTIGRIVVTKKGRLPKQKREDGKLIKYELVDEDYKQSYWLYQPTFPNCNELARTLASMPHMLTGTFLVECFSSKWYNANPNLVIDVMAILMQDGYIDQEDCDTVFSKVYPFSEAKWVEDAKWKADAFEAFFELTGRLVSSYPNKGERTQEDAEDWFENHVPAKLEVLKWKGQLENKNKDKNSISIAFEVERAVIMPGASGRTKYHIGNRNKGDQPARTQFLRFPKFKHRTIRHIRGRRSDLKAPFLWYPMSSRLWKILGTFKKKREADRKFTIGDAVDLTAQLAALHAASAECEE
jgi:hypothetical protein